MVLWVGMMGVVVGVGIGGGCVVAVAFLAPAGLSNGQPAFMQRGRLWEPWWALVSGCPPLG